MYIIYSFKNGYTTTFKREYDKNARKLQKEIDSLMLG